MEWETIYGQILAKANHYLAVPDSVGGRRIIKDEALRQYERDFKRQCSVYRSKNINKPFKLHAIIYHSSRRYDLDNSLKTLLDMLQDVGAISNDNLCMEIDARKVVDGNCPRVTYAIEEYEPRLF